LEIVAS